MTYTLYKLSSKGWTFTTTHPEVVLDQLAGFICKACIKEDCPTYSEYLEISPTERYNYPEKHSEIIDKALVELLGTSCGAEFMLEESE